MEWTKLRTVRSTAWNLLALVTTTVAVSAFAADRTAPTDCSPRPCMLDTARIALAGIYIGQIAVVALAVLAITAEYDTRTIGPTLQAQPCRWRVLTAKATVVLALVLSAGAVAVAGCVVVGRVILARNGFTADTGYPLLLAMSDPTTRRALLGTVVYLGLVALLSLGVAATLRSTAAAVTAVLSLLYVVPIAARFVTDPEWQTILTLAAPMTSGLAVQSTRPLNDAAISPWAGLAVLAAYAGVALMVGFILFQTRDA